MNNNGKIFKWIIGILIGIILSLVSIVYFGVVKTTDATATELSDHKKAQMITDINTATAITSLSEKMDNTIKGIEEIKKMLIRYGVK